MCRRLSAISLVFLGALAGCSTNGDAPAAASDGGVADAHADASLEATAPAGPTVRVPAVFSPDGVFVELTLDGGATAYFSLDTAAWFSIVDPKAGPAAGVSSGDHDVLVGSALHLGTKNFQSLALAVTSLDIAALPKGAKVIGTAGNNLWVGYRVGFDPAGGQLWLTPDGNPAPARPGGLAAPVVVKGEHVAANDTTESGGIFAFPCRFATAGATSTCMFDTGAPPPPTVIGALGQSSEYESDKSVPSNAADFTGKNLGGGYRLTTGLFVGDATTRVTKDQVVVAFDHFDVLEQEAAFFKRDIEGLVGAEDAFFSELSMSEATLSLYPYATTRPSERSYFVGYGVIAVGSAAGGATIAVVKGSDAEKKGVLATDIWVGVDGAQVFSPAGVLLDDPGKTRTFSFTRNGNPLSLVIAAEDLLAP